MVRPGRFAFRAFPDNNMREIAAAADRHVLHSLMMSIGGTELISRPPCSNQSDARRCRAKYSAARKITLHWRSISQMRITRTGKLALGDRHRCSLTTASSGAARTPTGRYAGPRPLERGVRLAAPANLARRSAIRVCQPGPVAFHSSMTSAGSRIRSIRGIGRAGRPASSPPHAPGPLSRARQILVLVRTDRMRIDASEIRFQSTAQAAFLRSHTLSHAEDVADIASLCVANERRPASRP